ncbi:ABC transporter substrate-binding protein [Nocardioides taihuensis]|uniref:ABC transporter substrate-binding protein n=1 Tax=Nocardioides taihuensis TaxID=1835606 RepID=A0ABW0BKS4_9ACTN
MRRRRAVAAALATLVVLGVTTACEAGSDDPPPSPDPQPSASSEAKLTVAVTGTEDEIAAYTSVIETFDSLSDDAEVSIESYPTEAALMARLRQGGAVPDVFLASRDDLAWLLEQGVTQPVDQLLDERGVDFGDGYSRDGLQAFSVDNSLQCMPYAISPMVMYYNTDLVDFAKMEKRGLPVPSSDPPLSWGFDVFAAAAEFASRPARGTKGLYVDPTLRDLSPMVYSGGGQLFDDDADPTSLTLADSSESLERWLELLRNPQLTLTPEQLQRRPALEWFERGKLAMIPGYRDWVPELRLVHGLQFDTIAMPVLDTSATVGDVVGLCLSADAASTPAAADLMVHMLSTPSVQRVALEGYIVPANLEVALSDDFLQPGRQPEHSGVFNSAVRAIDFPPLISTWAQLERLVAGDLQALIDVPVLDDLAERLQAIDEKSRTVLDPESVEPSESGSESGSPGSTSGDGPTSAATTG